MLNRRNLRIKTMQIIFASESNPLPYGTLTKQLERNIRNTYTLYLYVFHAIQSIAKYVKTDNERKKAKLLKSDNLQINTCILDNPLIQSLITDSGFQDIVEGERFDVILPDDIVRQLFYKMTNLPQYQNYIQLAEIALLDHTKIIKVLFKRILLKEDLFTHHLEEKYSNWLDDKSTIINVIIKKINTFETSPESFNVLEKIDWKELLKFSTDLLHKNISQNKELEELLVPLLENWAADRVTKVDMILMKMALTELLYFPSIPVKVTLNEYIDISKKYSTPKSKEFINGILDRLMKKLKEDKRINKLGRGLVE